MCDDCFLSVAESVADAIERKQSIDGRCGRAESDQRIHVRRAVKQIAETIDKIIAVPI